MITLETKPGCTLLLVEWPNNSDGGPVEGCEIRGNHTERACELLSYYGESDAIELPLGSYEFIATTDTLTEEQATALVERREKGYPDYNPYNDRMHVDSAVVSFRTAMDQSGAEPTKTYAILKQLP